MTAVRRLAAPLLVLPAAGLVLAGCGAEPRTPWFGPYVDVTAYPYFEFGSWAAGQSHTVLGFVVADPDEPCRPSWGGWFGLDEAAQRLDLDRQVAALREEDVDVVVSFGGFARDELATTCEDAEQLTRAYRSVIERYGLGTVDFDIEANDLEDAEANLRRAEVVARLQRERPAEDPLQVWVTVPVAPDGLPPASQRLVAQMLEAGVDLAGVNLMTMNYGAGRPPEQTMAEAAEQAARAAHAELSEIHARTGRSYTDAEVWHRMGLTPMIGQNDIPGEVFDLAAAARLNEFAREQGIGRMSFWSLNRDRACDPGEAAPGVAAERCSGTEQQTGGYSRVLGEGLGG